MLNDGSTTRTFFKLAHFVDRVKVACLPINSQERGINNASGDIDAP
jgi:hypothetical protein